MIVRNVSLEQLQQCAEIVGVTVKETGYVAGNGLRVRIFPLSKSDHFRRTSAGWYNPDRRVHAVCWHGHWAWMHAVYDVVPNAVFRTAKATYKSREDLETIGFELQFQNVGAAISPRQYREVCLCS